MYAQSVRSARGKMRTLCAALLGLLLCQSISSQNGPPDITGGNGLLETCTDETSVVHELQHAYCMGYLLGAREGLTILQAQIKKDKNIEAYFCAPEDATTGQIKDVIVNYLRDQALHEA